VSRPVSKWCSDERRVPLPLSLFLIHAS
jgi:hypothetical protein